MYVLFLVDGVWSDWRPVSVSPCSVTCGDGIKKTVLERTCIGPSFGGKPCVGNNRMTMSSQCRSKSCPGITIYCCINYKINDTSKNI